MFTAGIRHGSSRHIDSRQRALLHRPFIAATFAVGFLTRCLGMHAIFAAGRTGEVDGARATGLTAVPPVLG
jgi:hypothetical protein